MFLPELPVFPNLVLDRVRVGEEGIKDFAGDADCAADAGSNGHRSLSGGGGVDRIVRVATMFHIVSMGGIVSNSSRGLVRVYRLERTRRF